MAIIADTYEIKEQIGAGGGGIVYLGRHIRLNKKIVLKADKRTLKAGEDALRREVDLLKNLTHTYIPQVYDFVQENGSVYTVMDYVEGESLDKYLDRLLARGETVAQKDAVRFACQLLDALQYLHSQGENGILHGDIKPANIMLRPSGDICLIDYNIALALGEDGAVKVGFSRGYASPEHYGSDDMQTHFPGEKSSHAKEERTEPVSASSGQKALLLDARSDIYSLGATLYHLLSGKKPAQNAAEVVPLGSLNCCSAEVAAIIQKAMHPEKEKRYQSAGEMLDALLHLRTRDRRVVRSRRRYALAMACSVLVFMAGGVSAFAGMNQMEEYQESLTLASYSEAAFADGDVVEAVELAMSALSFDGGIFRMQAPPQARKALTDALGVYDLSDGFKAACAVSLPSAPLDLAVSPDGSFYAVVYAYEAAVFRADAEHAAEAVTVRKLQPSALSDCLFLDNQTIVYAGENGIEAYDFQKDEVLWTGEEVTNLAVSGDGKLAAGINRDNDYAVLYRTRDGKKLSECRFGGRHLRVAANDIFADPADYVFALDYSGEWLAVSFSDGGLSIFHTSDSDRELVLYEESEYNSINGGFSGELFTYAAQGAPSNLFGIVDPQEETFVGSLESRDNIVLQNSEQYMFLSNGNLLAQFDAETLNETEIAYTEGKNIQKFDCGYQYSMLETDDYAISFYDMGGNLVSQLAYESPSDFLKLLDGYALLGNRDEPELQLLALEDHRDKEILSYDASYRHNEARISADQKSAVLFGYSGFRIYDMDGTLKKEFKLPEPDNIYDQQYIREGENSYLEVVWYDGTVRQYGADGTLIAEEQRQEPDKSLEEEFLTDKYRIVSKLHEEPQVYERESGKYVRALEKDAYLTYVTQLEEYIVIEYISAATGQRYGLLLDPDLETLAYLPDLCDVYGTTLVFDDGSGSIRSCRIYSLEELEELGGAYRKENGVRYGLSELEPERN